MARDQMVDFHGTDLLAAFVDEFLDAAREIQVAVLVQLPEVAGAEEMAVGCEAGGVGGGVGEIAGRDAGGADADFAFAALRYGLLRVGAQNTQFDVAPRKADATCVVRCWRERV